MSNRDNQEIKNVNFKVDAGLIDRLGRELVGRAETAVSELVKNAYDADAKKVVVEFINTETSGGIIKISDDGIGMSIDQLINGFMTISSTDKVHNPKSIKYERNKAGKKGIGRFATQRLGDKLLIITQTINSPKAIKVTIDWANYAIDQDITKIDNPIEYISKSQEEGTILVIENVRDSWTGKSIERVYRYVSDLLQPDYLSDRSTNLSLATQNDKSFKVSFYQTINNEKELIADPQKMLYSKAVAIIEGYVDNKKEGFYGVKSESLDIDDYAITIQTNKEDTKYRHIQNIHFKAYYFIYKRIEYYTNISKLELANIQNLSKEYGGIRLYRNGFRVLPYGESKDDWLGLDIRYSGEDGGGTNIPFANKNLFGFVEIIDPEGVLFEETASREGLIENEATEELKDFLFKALTAARFRISEGITIIKKKTRTSNKEEKKEERKSPQENFKTLEVIVNKEQNEETKKKVETAIQELKQEVESLIEELGMLRVLAALGLTIAEYTHEIVQFTPSINGYLNALIENHNNDASSNLLNDLKRSFANFTSYTAYFNATVSQNVSRELKPILLIDVINMFVSTITEDLNRQGIQCYTEFYNQFHSYTVPMHASEWNSILFNLYTNAKKAIKRTKRLDGKIGIITGVEGETIYLEFTDNGDGIPEENKDRIFNAFFTTSTPAGFDAAVDERLTGTGLGLKIVKDIIEAYKGKIFLLPPEKDFVTCLRLEVPKASEENLKSYGL